MRFRGRHVALALPLALGLLAGCGEERDPVSYVQPYVLEKSFFVGENLLDPADDPEFYSQATLIDVGYGAAQDGLFTSTYAQPMSRVKWVIQEDMLVARLSYERIEDSDGKGAGPSSNDGIVVAAFNIRSHFDIQRRYNPTTGEEYNVIEENTTDRPWYERRYMRVDWDKNLVTDNYDFDTLSMIGVYGGVTYEPISYHINDPSSEDAPYFDQKTGYFDITSKVYARPQMLDLSYLGWGIDKFPACFLDADIGGGKAPAATCAPVELTIRHAFRPVFNRDYEPQDWDGFRFNAFGAFTVERYGYARNYGMTDDRHHYFVTRYNIWERSHYYKDPVNMEGPVECYTPTTTPAGADPTRDEMRIKYENGVPVRDADGNLVLVAGADGTADECQEVSLLVGMEGSQCDHFSQKCTLPYRARKEVPQVWYYATGSDPRFFDGTEWAAHDWDVALRSAVASARYAECQLERDLMKTGADCGALYPVWHGQQDDNHDAVILAREIDACRRGTAYTDREDCNALADELGKKRNYTAGVIATAKMPEMVVLCHSPVHHDDPEVCGPIDQRLPAQWKNTGKPLTSEMCDQARLDRDKETLAVCNAALNARRGDLRFHVVNAIREPQTPSPWGIMTDSDDPLTGEKVAASINVWTYVTDSWSQSVVDMARYIAGELETSDVTEGTYVKDWSEAAKNASSSGMLGQMTADEVDKRLAAAGKMDVEQFRKIRSQWQNVDSRVKSDVKRIAKLAHGVKASIDAPSVNRAAYAARRNAVLGTATEAELVTPMMQQLVGAQTIPDTDLMMNFASPFRGTNPTLAREIRQMKENALARQGACILEEAPAPLAIADLTNVLQEKFGNFNPSASKAEQLARAEQMRAFIAQRAHYATIVHEMGHSVGLRHNFVSSADSWGYRPQYWQLRTKNGEIDNDCVDPATDQPGLQPDGNCVGPRFYDPITDEEKSNLIWMWSQSSTMDYAGETAQDFLGLGAYDFAAARMFYGETMPVFSDASYRRNTGRGKAMLEKLDNFGGTVGMRYVDPEDTDEFIHYSALQRNFELIRDCYEVNPNDYKPETWNTERDGQWNPLLDGHIVKVDGKYSRCRQQKVDYVPYRAMRTSGFNVFGELAGPQFDAKGRVRVPYGFATDSWADLGNLSVYRHDNGADPYELFDFFITQQEVGHIFDNYRRNRATFSVRGAAGRNMARFNEKMRDGAKGLGLMANIYREFSIANGYDYNTLWPFIASDAFPVNILASTIAFDQFARMLQRPEAGPHFMPAYNVSQFGGGIPYEDGVWRSIEDTYNNAAPEDEAEASLIIPNGATGKYGNVSWGGRPVENALSDVNGEYNSRYTVNAGSYYDKAYTAILMTESVDNFISDSLGDFVDARYRSVSLADLFPDGYRRFLANNLTGDDALKGPRIAAKVSGARLVPDVGTDKYPAGGIGWTSWTPATGPEACFPTGTNLLCTTDPANTIVLDPQVGWEQQKFLIAWTLQYLPENQKQHWLNQMYLWELGADSDPGFQNRIELHDPMGRIYVAKTFGKESIYGKIVQKGISARMLEYANELLVKAYETTPGPDLDGDGAADWYEPVLGSNGQPVVLFDPQVVTIIDEEGHLGTSPTCNETTNEGCTCEQNRACVKLRDYMEVPFFLRQAMFDYQLADPTMRGIY
jgi:hypothetical protein